MMRVIPFVLLMTGLAVTAAAEQTPVARDREFRLDVSVDISRSTVSGLLSFPVRSGVGETLASGGLDIRDVAVNGKALAAQEKEGAHSFVPPEDGVAEVRFAGTFAASTAVGDRNYGVVSSVIDKRGVSLTGLWYPRPQGPAVWKLTAALPAKYEAVSEAETITAERSENGVRFTFDFPHPVDGLSLVATDRYEVTKERHGSVELVAYFFPEDRELARTYLQATKKYLELYEKLLIPYPYRRFAVVENFLSTGYSFPTYTLLGQDVVRLPFITETSLGHEVLHQWFGNSVYIDEREGNWAEGLTAYLADHWYDELKGKGWEHRKQLLVNYAAYVDEKKDFPLRQFRSRMDLASRAIGYGKAAMVFHLLRKEAGDERFFAALRAFLGARRFREGSWSDLRSAFEQAMGKDLEAFFTAWLDGKGLPVVAIENADLRRKGNRFEISFSAMRKNYTLPLDLLVEIRFLQGGTEKKTVRLDRDAMAVSLFVDEEPSLVVIDGDYDLARQLTGDELPAVISMVTGADAPLVVLPESGAERYQAVIDGLVQQGGATREAAEAPDGDVRNATAVILGRDHPLAARLFGMLDLPVQGFSIAVRKNPWDDRRAVAIVHAESAAETAAAFEKIYHYGKYTFLSFVQGRNKTKELGPSDRGIVLPLRDEPPVFDLRQLKTVSAIVEGTADKRIVYVGEYHDRFSHHNVQLRLIRALHAKDRSIAVGMEMFQRPFQQTLDDYVGGTIDEREFLKRSEYFKRWGFDYNLYKPIIDFCRAEKVPVVALNLRREITEKVSKGGMDALTDEERKELPRETDFSDQEYRDRLRQVFTQHQTPSEQKKNFDFFVQAQVLWDETMAESIDGYLRKNPDRRMVVIAGGGHLTYGAGIPKRAHRRNGLPYAVVLNDGDLEPGIADFVVLPAALEGATAPKLLATFREEKGALFLKDFIKDSPALKAGLQAGDRLIALDGAPVGDMQEIRLALFFKSKGDVILVTVERKRFLLGEKVMTVEVKL